MAEGLQEAVCCSVCQTTSTPVWQRNDDDTIVCLECHSNKKEKNTASNSDTTQLLPKKKKRKTKIERAGRNSNSPLVSTVNKITYRGRRSLAKDIPIKSPAPKPGILTTSSVLYKGVAYGVGDVVSILDYSGGTYYAIIRGLLVDQYSEKYAMLTWLLPKLPNPVEFDPLCFILGPEDDDPHSLDVLEFVCHSPRSSSFSCSSQYDIDLLNLWVAPKPHSNNSSV